MLSIYDSIRVMTWAARLIFSCATFAIADKLFGNGSHQHEDIVIGCLVTNHRGTVHGSQDPLDIKTIFVKRGSVGCVVEKYLRPDRPGSSILIRVLFPQGLCWISAYSVSRVK